MVYLVDLYTVLYSAVCSQSAQVLIEGYMIVNTYIGKEHWGQTLRNYIENLILLNFENFKIAENFKIFHHNITVLC